MLNILKSFINSIKNENETDNQSLGWKADFMRDVITEEFKAYCPEANIVWEITSKDVSVNKESKFYRGRAIISGQHHNDYIIKIDVSNTSAYFDIGLSRFGYLWFLSIHDISYIDNKGKIGHLIRNLLYQFWVPFDSRLIKKIHQREHQYFNAYANNWKLPTEIKDMIWNHYFYETKSIIEKDTQPKN